MIVGVFDSGIGGLSFFRELDRKYPWISRIYLGDHANLPYGEKSKQEIARLAYKGAKHLLDLGCTELVIACNTASILAFPSIREALGREKRAANIFDISSPTIELLQALIQQKMELMAKENYRIGIFATLATVESGYFEKNILSLGDIEVQQVACHRLVEVIENASSTDCIRDCIHLYVQEMKQKFLGVNPNIVILGCTHYSVVKDIFIEVIGGDCIILSQESLLLKNLFNSVVASICAPTQPIRRLLTTGDAGAASRAANFLTASICFDFEHTKI